jgi:TRAP-type C4-dicarboxylate transport system permease large subunit
MPFRSQCEYHAVCSHYFAPDQRHRDEFHPSGAMIVLNAMIGLVTPPVGALLFTLSALEKIKIEDIVREIWPFIGILLAVLFLVILWPDLVLLLPMLLFKDVS